MYQKNLKKWKYQKIGKSSPEKFHKYWKLIGILKISKQNMNELQNFKHTWYL